jgi:hypothetical protein
MPRAVLCEWRDMPDDHTTATGQPFSTEPAVKAMWINPVVRSLDTSSFAESGCCHPTGADNGIYS